MQGRDWKLGFVVENFSQFCLIQLYMYIVILDNGVQLVHSFPFSFIFFDIKEFDISNKFGISKGWSQPAVGQTDKRTQTYKTPNKQ